jgi:hypothetical protein
MTHEIEAATERVRIINWRWRTFARSPWPVLKYTRHMKWVRGCSSLIIGPYELIWRTR